MAKKKKDQDSSLSQQVGIGIGLTAAAVGAAGAYFLYGSKNAAKNRKTVKSWMLKAKAEVLEGLEEAQQMTWDEYEALVDQVANTYTSFKGATKKDVKEFAEEMKQHWNKIEKEAPQAKRKAAKATAKAAGKVEKKAKKVAKKASKKAAK